MGTLLLVVGCVWLALAAIFVLALMLAGRRAIPDPTAVPESPAPSKRAKRKAKKQTASATAERCLEQQLLDV
jgi:hypothetical protein